MTKKTFNDVLKRLEKYYGGSQVDEWAVKEYYNACYCVFDADAQAFYSEMLNAFKFFPRVSEFREVAEKYRDKKNKTKHENAEFCYCCLNTGIVLYVKKGLKPFPDYEYEFASRCYCEAGKNKPDWPLCTSVVTRGELEWLYSENYRRHGNTTPDEGKKAKEYVTTFIKGFSSCNA